jgi:hypothetical protein
VTVRFHILAQYVWPDDAPTGLYAEHVAAGLVERGLDAVLVAGQGSYRPVVRPAPRVPIARLPVAPGRRGRLVEVLREYFVLAAAYRRYILDRVSPGDVVVATSAPPATVFLHRTISSRGARSVYWLQDYYPELVRGLREYPPPARIAFARLWDAQLRRWDRVVKAAGNLAYEGGNAIVIRNWPTVDLGPVRPPVPRTALYSGNLGYGHDVEAFLAACRDLHDQGYRIVVRGDGPGMHHLPPWVQSQPPTRDVEALVRSYWDAEVHLVAAHPRIVGAIFPSKFWNSLATRRTIVTTGFAGPMAAELELARASDYSKNCGAWVDELERVARSPREASA